MKLIVTTLTVLFGLCLEAHAQSAFTDTWKARFTASRVQDSPAAQAPTNASRDLEFAAAVNQIQRDARGEGLLLVPDGVKDIRGVIVISPREGLGFDVFQDPQWQRLARELQFGLVGASIRHISAPLASSIGPGHIPDAAPQVLEMLLTELAEQSGHPEVARAPFLLLGEEGGLISRLAAQLSERTIGILDYHSAGFVDAEVLRRIPMLIFVGGKDPGARGSAETRWTAGRSAGAPWTFVLEPNATPQTADLKPAHGLFVSWITAVVDRRMSPDGGRLGSVDAMSGWLGNNQTGEVAPFATYSTNKSEASWLPDEASARQWRALLGAK